MPSFHIVLDPPVAGEGPVRVGLAVGVHREGHPGTAEHIPHPMVAGVPVEIRDQEDQKMAPGIRPAQHLLQGRRPLAEILPHHLIQRHPLGRPQGEPQAHRQAGPSQGLQRGPDPGPGTPRPPQAVAQADQDGVVGDLHVPGQDVHPQGDGRQQRPGEGRRAAEQRTTLDHPVKGGEKIGEPGRAGDDHGEHHADHHEGAQLIGDPGEGRCGPAQAPGPRQGIHPQAGQEQLQGVEQRIGLGEGEKQEKRGERVEGGVLPVGQEGSAGEQIWVP
jgi:hypothetical protein